MLDTEQTPAPEAVETPVETPVEETPIPEPADALDAEVVTESAETPEVAEESGEKEVDAAEETGAAGEVVPVTFDAELDVPALIEQGKAELENYNVPQPLQAYIEALEAKAVAPQIPEAVLYGDALPDLLKRQNFIDTIEEVDGIVRPRTDLYIAEVADPTKRAWLRHDINKLPSDKYPGLNAFEELIADGLALPNESYQDTLNRYTDTMTAMRTGATIVPDIPAFIPSTLQEAFSKLPKDTRSWIAGLDVEDEVDVQTATDQIAQLELIQKGLDADKANAVRETQSRQYTQNQMNERVYTTQVKFFDTFRENFVADLAKDVQFSTDPNIQAISVAQNVALLTQALDDTTTGEFARKSLTTAGIKFDHATAQQMMKDVEKAAISLANAQSLTDAQGNTLDKVALNKATEEFKSVGKRWQSFAKDIIDQQARLVSTGKAEEVKDAVAKQKIEVKARPALKGTPNPAVKKEVLPMRGTQEWKEFWANKAMEEEARKTRAYASA